MPLKESKSKKAFEENIGIERQAGKPMKQALAIAYSVKRKNSRKMAEGGKLDTNAREHIKAKNFAEPKDRKYPIENPSHARNALARVSQFGSPEEKAKVRAAVHRKYPDMKAEGGDLKPEAETTVRPDAGYGKVIMIKAKGGLIDESAKTERRPMPRELDKDEEVVHENAHMEPNHEDRMTDRPEMKQVRKGKTFSLQPIKHPNMVESSKIHPRLRDELDDIRFAKGGEINDYLPMEEAEEDRLEMPYEPVDDMEKAPSEDEFMDNENHRRFAKGGEIEDRHPENEEEIHREMDEQPEDEEEEEHHSSIAATIMARKAAAKALRSGSRDEDEAEAYAEGGHVDIEENEEESPYGEPYDHDDEAILKEHYGDDLDDREQPEHSNEIGDPEEMDDENEHDEDVVDRIRRNMHRESPMVRRHRR